MATGAMMMLKNMFGIDVEQIEKEFKTQITSIQTTIVDFDNRLTRIEKLLILLCDNQGIVIPSNNGVIHHGEAGAERGN